MEKIIYYQNAIRVKCWISKVVKSNPMGVEAVGGVFNFKSDIITSLLEISSIIMYIYLG